MLNLLNLRRQKVDAWLISCAFICFSIINGINILILQINAQPWGTEMKWLSVLNLIMALPFFWSAVQLSKE